jgi:uncharacterized membrane protein YfcA
MSFIIYLIIGAFSGTLAGLLGLGGGIIVVPALAATFSSLKNIPVEHVMHVAVGTSLATIVITFLSSLRAHVQRHAVRWDIVKMFLPGLIVGVVAGAAIANKLPSGFLSVFFSIFLLVVAWRLFADKIASPAASLPSRPIVFVVMTVIGILSSLLGAGGGIVLIPFMMRANINLREATGTSVACGVFIGLAATLCFMLLGQTAIHLPLSVGYIYLPAFLGVALTSVLFAPIGTAVAYKLSPPVLKRILAIFLIIVAIDMLISSF